jgi:hypothetical protein
VSQLAALAEGHLDATQAEGDQASDQEQPYSNAKEEGAEQQGKEREGGTVIKTSTSMPLVSNQAAGSARAAICQQVRRIVVK